MAPVLTRSVRATRRFRASPERVFAAWLDADLARRWLFATATHPMAEVAIDARVGGSFRVVDGERGVEHTGAYLEIVPPRRLSFSLSLEGDLRAVTHVTVDIAETRNGCAVTLVQTGVPREHARTVADRWCGMLYGLGEIACPGGRCPTSHSSAHCVTLNLCLEELTMKYLCLVYMDEDTVGDVPDTECKACNDDFKRRGHHVAAAALQSVRTATTVRVRDGKVSVTDGPFAETKEQLAGFYLLEATDLNEAIQLAAKIPPARLGTIEVRPVRELAA